NTTAVESAQNGFVGEEGQTRVTQ
ncbi:MULTISPECIES: hypothetical protein, partial [Salmonella]